MLNSSVKNEVINRLRIQYGIDTAVSNAYLGNLVDLITSLIKIHSHRDYSEKTYVLVLKKGDKIRFTDSVFALRITPANYIFEDNYYHITQDGTYTIRTNHTPTTEIVSVLAYLAFYAYKNQQERLQGVTSITQNTGVVSETTAYDINLVKKIQETLPISFWEGVRIILATKDGVKWL